RSNLVDVFSQSVFTLPQTSDVDSLAAGDYHTLYADFWGLPAGWGRNSSGQLGRGAAFASDDVANPVQLPNGGVKAVAGGGSHSLALRIDGTVWAWGSNQAGQLGNGTTADSATPLQVRRKPVANAALQNIQA